MQLFDEIGWILFIDVVEHMAWAISEELQFAVVLNRNWEMHCSVFSASNG